MQIFSKASIRAQILTGFMPVLIVLGILAIVSHGNFKTFFTKFNALNDVTREAELFLEIDKDIVELQRNVLVYSYVGYRGVLRKIEFLQGKLEDKFETVRPITARNEQTRDRFNRMIVHYTKHKNGFAEAVKERGAIKTLIDTKLEPLITQTHTILNEMINSFEKSERYDMAYKTARIERNLLQADVNIKGFENSPDAMLVSNTSTLFKDMINDAQTLRNSTSDENERTAIETFIEKLDAYQAIFREVTNKNRTYQHLVNVVLAGKAAEMNALSGELDTLVSNRADNLKSNITDSMHSLRDNYTLLSIIAALIGIISAILIAAGIAHPVKKMATTLTQLADGQSDTRIPGQSRKDEVGEMARAADAFKNMATRIEEQSEAITQSERRLQLVLEGSREGIWDWPNIENIDEPQYWSPRFYELLGYKDKEIEASYPNFITILHPDDVELTNSAVKAHLENDEPYDIEYRLKVKSGEYKWFRARGTKSSNDDGTTRFSGIVADIQTRKIAEAALVQANTELEEFAYRTSHDLRSPLVSSIKLLTMTQKAIEDDNKEHAQKSIEHVQTSLEKLEILVKDILSLTQTKNAVEDIQSVNIKESLDEAIHKFEHMDGFDRLDIETQIKSVKSIKTQKIRFQQIIENLVSNAIKYQDPDQESPFLKITTRKSKNNLILEVHDNGLGIPKDQQEQLFTMFKRFHPKVSFGSGLGLYMMKKSADVIHAKIEFEDPGNGSLFRLTVPLTPPEELNT